MSDFNPLQWNDDDDADTAAPSSSSIDLSFHIDCRELPVDHTAALSSAICEVLPWLAEEPGAGLHLIHLAGSQNGWMRPEAPDELLYLSRRTRLTIRIPAHRQDAARTLENCTLDIAGHSMKVGDASEKSIVSTDILISRHVINQGGDDETAFLQWAANELQKMQIRFKKLLPGKRSELSSPHGPVDTRSLLVADLHPQDSIRLQEQGLGEGRHFGCGLFIPHKGIAAVKPD